MAIARCGWQAFTLNFITMSHYKHAQYIYSHKLRRALQRGHTQAYGLYLAELAQERQRALAKYRLPAPPNKP
jgi:hypothetical protein